MKKNIKYLGVSFDSSLSWKYQILGDPKFDNHTQGLMKKNLVHTNGFIVDKVYNCAYIPIAILQVWDQAPFSSAFQIFQTFLPIPISILKFNFMHTDVLVFLGSLTINTLILLASTEISFMLLCHLHKNFR